jgi:crotonobetainyl-CoA:carnitine CoA-transferase CaiB-like acyl-CoA transferase
MKVLDWEKMMELDAYRTLQMEQTLNAEGKKIITTRCPVRINGKRLVSEKPAPALGAHNKKIMSDFSIAE